MEVWDAVELALAICQDKTLESSKSSINQSYLNLCKADAECRRQKTSSDIIQMVRLKIAKEQFEREYVKLKVKTGRIREVEDLLTRIQMEIDDISAKKNRKRN